MKSGALPTCRANSFGRAATAQIIDRGHHFFLEVPCAPNVMNFPKALSLLWFALAIDEAFISLPDISTIFVTASSSRCLIHSHAVVETRGILTESNHGTRSR
jgi:hypothetical protein